MKMQTKLFLSVTAFALAVFLHAGAIGHSFGANTRSPKALTILFVSMCLVAGLSYLISVTWSRRLERLAAQTQQLVRNPAIHTIDISVSNDEIAVIAKSINELKSELTKGEEMRNQLVADAAHELRTPLAILRGHLEAILEGAEEPKRENLLPLLDETKRMSRLLQEMRDLNLAEAGKLVLERAWIPVRAFVQEIVSILEIEAEAKGIDLALTTKGDGEIYCDESRMKQVLINLIGNAIRYTPERRRVRVECVYEEGEVRIRVSDNGRGIAPEHLPYLFKRFYRVDGSRNRLSGGTGLGLAIAKEFVEAHGGTIRVTSKTGAGTSFLVTLPVFPLTP